MERTSMKGHRVHRDQKAAMGKELHHFIIPVPGEAEFSANNSFGSVKHVQAPWPCITDQGNTGTAGNGKPQ